jgi:glycosylphosphatidylinositol transamidase (GPIT) subunit GPI8
MRPVMMREMRDRGLHHLTPAGHVTDHHAALNTSESSRVVIMLCGHGGEGYLKFQDSEELTTAQLAQALAHMHAKRR